MRKIVVVEHLTLDGVMQAPGGPDEDTRDGFPYGGWAAAGNDDVMSAEMGKGMGGADLLFGRRTYQQFASFWPHQPEPNPFTEVLNRTQKYVVSTTLSGELPWQNSTLLRDDGAVERLKQEPGADLAVMGSGELVQSLARRGLVDCYTLMIHPLVLGAAGGCSRRPGSRCASPIR